MNFRAILKAIGVTTGVVLTGAVGSGVWEKILSPLLQYTSSAVNLVLVRFSASYSNTLYSSAATYPGTAHYADVSSMMVVLIFLIFIGWSLRSETGLVGAFIEGLTEPPGRFCALFASICLVLIVILSIQKMEAGRIQRKNLTQLEIIRPTVGEQRYLQLRAQYFSMKTESDYIAFRKVLAPIEHPVPEATESSTKRK